MKAAIFDVDGTLVDSVDLHAKAWQAAFSHFGHNHSFDAIRSQIGKGGDQLMPVFLPQEEVDAKGHEIEKYRGNLFTKEFMSSVKPFPLVRELFQRLLADGWKIALASSAKKDELQTYKDLCRVTDLLDTETTSEDAEKSKPHPDIFEAARKRLGGIAAADCVVVGDSPYDAEAADKAGMHSIGLLSGGFPATLLRAAGFEALYPDVAALLGRYGETIFSREWPSGVSKT